MAVVKSSCVGAARSGVTTRIGPCKGGLPRVSLNEAIGGEGGVDQVGRVKALGDEVRSNDNGQRAEKVMRRSGPPSVADQPGLSKPRRPAIGKRT